MGFYHSIEAGRQTPAGSPVSPVTTELPTRPPETEILPIIPSLLTPDAFRNLGGYIQQYVLLSLLADRNNAKLNQLRSDMKVNQVLTEDELVMSFLVGEIIKSDQPITVSSGSNSEQDKIFAQIYGLAGPNPNKDGKKETKQEVADILERERNRAHFEFPGSLFAPAEDIGNFSAARRYLANLTFVVKPDQLEITREIIQREQAEINANKWEVILPGVPFS